MRINCCYYCWLSTHTFSFYKEYCIHDFPLFLSDVPAVFSCYSVQAPGFQLSSQMNQAACVSWSASAQSEKERPSALLGCPAEQVLAHSEGTWLCERPSSPWSHSCALRLVDWLNPDDLFWHCGVLLEMGIPVKVSPLVNDGQWEKETCIWCCTNYFAWGIVQEYSERDAVMVICSCLFGSCTRSQLAKHLSFY